MSVAIPAESTVRRRAAALGLGIEKSRVRDQSAYEYGRYVVFDFRTRTVVDPGPVPHTHTLADVVDLLDERAGS